MAGWAGWGKKLAFRGSIESMSGCTWDRVGTVQKGEVLDLETVYNSSKSVPDAMGIMMAFVFETDDLAGGTPAPPDACGETAPPVASTPPPSSHDPLTGGGRPALTGVRLPGYGRKGTPVPTAEAAASTFHDRDTAEQERRFGEGRAI